MKTLIILVTQWVVAAAAADLPNVTELNLSEQDEAYQEWVQVAMREGDSNLYAFSCNIGYTNWSFVTGGTNKPVPIYTDPLTVIRDPSHIHYNGKYYLVYNTESQVFGVAVSDDDLHWSYAGRASIGPGAYWSPKFFVDGTNCLWCNVRYSNVPGGVYPWQQYCFRFDTSNPTNTVDRDGRFFCTNIWHQDQGDRPTAQVVWNNGLFYLINQGGDCLCSPTLLSNCWTQIGTNLFGNAMDGPCMAKYQGVWYITDSQNGSAHWFRSDDLTNWTATTRAGWTAFGLEEGTAIVEDHVVKKVQLTWNPNYTGPGQATVVAATDDLTKPLAQWQIVYTGTANECIITNDRPARYFSAHNIVTP